MEGTAIPTPPDADLYEISARLRFSSTEPVPRAASQSPAPLEEGRQESFSVINLDSYVRFPATATLRLVTPHAYWFTDNSLIISQDSLASSAMEFEEKIYPLVTRYFGTEWIPGVDGDPHLAVLNTAFTGAAGYYSSADEYPRSVHPYSNQREMIYINSRSLQPGTQSYNDVLAHELQHAAHWRADPTEESWVNEGLSVLAEDLAGFPPNITSLFTRSPDVQLTSWEPTPSENGPHYAASYLFMKYLMQHFGGPDALIRLVEEPKDDVAGVESFLSSFTNTFPHVFQDWVVANYLGDSGQGPYRLQGLTATAVPTKTLAKPQNLSDSVSQYAAKYYKLELKDKDITVSFSGAPLVNLLPNDPHGGSYEWWGNRGDSIDSSLTRELDLASLSKATLEFWLWYDLEDGWDYAYIEVSPDGGKSWDILQGQHTTTRNPVGNGFGPGYTGKSGGNDKPQWVKESIDLSRYVGRKVLLRLEYITDEAVNLQGIAIDDIAIPQLNYRDDVEKDDGGWAVRGFVRTNNKVSEDYFVRLIETTSAGEIKVLDMPIDAAGNGQMWIRGLGSDIKEATLVVGAMAPATTEKASFQLSLSAATGN